MTAVLLSRHTMIGSYRLRGHRGGGGFSDVYEATGPTGDRVAVKVLRVSGVGDTSVTQRFRREREVLERLDSRRIARVIDSDLECPTPWIASEFVDGPNLREAISETGPLSPDVALHLAAFLAQTLAEIHSRGISHRDISPNNILLGPNGPVIIDFGSSRIDSSGDMGSVLSVGTPFYVSPEAISGDRVGTAADIYAFARVMQFVLTGTEDIQWSFSATTWDSTLCELLDRCLSTDPNHRPTAADIASNLDEPEIYPALLASAYSHARVKLLPRRFSPLTLLVTTGLLATIAGATVYLIAGRPEQPLTVDRLLDDHPSAYVEIETKSADVNRGWIRGVPQIPNSTIRYVVPEELSQESKYTTLDAYQINHIEQGKPTLSSIEISAEVMRNQLLVDFRIAVRSSSDKDLPLDSVIVASSMLQDAAQDRDRLTPWTCTLKLATHLKRQSSSARDHYIAAAITNSDCRDVDGNPWTTFIAYLFYPDSNAALLITARGHQKMINPRQILTAVRVSEESIINDFPDSAGESVALSELTSADLDAEILDFVDSATQPYLRRAWRLPSGRSYSLQLPDDDRWVADISMIAVANAVDENWSGTLADVIIPLGSVSSFAGGSSFILHNPTVSEWIVIFEIFDTYGGSAIGFKLSDGTGHGQDADLLTASAFQGTAKRITGTLPSSGYGITSSEFETKFQLPLHAGGNTSESVAVDRVTVGGVDFPVPKSWYAHPPGIGSRGGSAINLNPVDPFDLGNIEEDEPQIEIFEDSSAQIHTHMGGEAWLATDRYRKCLGTEAFALQRGMVFLEFRVFMQCEVSRTYGDADDPQLRFQRAPIIDFQISTQFYDPNWQSTWALGAVRGRFVPQFRSDLKYWSQFLEDVMSQASKIEQAQVIRCLQLFPGWAEHCSRPSAES